MRLTVLQTLPALESGGVERGTLEVARALVERGYRSIIISAGGRLAEQLRAEGSEHHAWPIGKKSPLTLALAPRLARFMRDNKVDIVHSRSRLPAWISHFALKMLDAVHAPGFVTTVHGAYSVNPYSRIMLAGDVVIAVSAYIRDYILDNYGHMDMNKVRLIHRGVDSADYPFAYQPGAAWLAQWRQTNPQLAGRKLLTLPGRISRRKGHEDFISIIERLIRQGLPVHGLIAGGAGRRRAFMRTLQRDIKRRRLQGHISFLGICDDLREIMAISSVVLSLAKAPEAFGRTSLEALSLGVPVVAYAHGGTAEVLSALQPQGLVPAKDIAQATDTVAAFLRQPPTVRRDHRFTLDNMLEKTIGVYERLYNITQYNGNMITKARL